MNELKAQLEKIKEAYSKHFMMTASEDLDFSLKILDAEIRLKEMEEK